MKVTAASPRNAAFFQHSARGRARRPSVLCRAGEVPNGSPSDANKPLDDDFKKLSDPERVFRQYGKKFGGGYRLSTDWMRDAPQVRVRTADDKARDQLVELAVLNARLAGQEPWEIRQRIEYLKLRRKNWEQIFQMVTRHEATATLASIEDCNMRVDEMLSDDYRERTSLPDLKSELQGLQSELSTAHSRMHETQQKLEFNVRKLEELRAEAAYLEELRRQQLAPSTADDVPSSPLAVAAAVSEALERRRASGQEAASSSPSTFSSSSSSPAAASLVDLLAMPGTSAPPKALSLPKRREKANLQNAPGLEPALREFWYPVEFSRNLTPDKLIPIELFGEPWVLFRDKQGKAGCIRDACAHRACPLSLGRVEDGEVMCSYHGWTFTAAGDCTKMPSTAFCKGVHVDALPCNEADGMIWVFPGTSVPPFKIPTNITEPPNGFDVHAEVVMEIPLDHSVVLQRMLDLSHTALTRSSRFAQGWPVPEVVTFRALEMLSGRWSPYPIDTSFGPPCMTLSTIGLSSPKAGQGGRNLLHQLHVALPAGRGRTRLLYRMSLDFMAWARGLPQMDNVWSRVAHQVLGEDLVMVLDPQVEAEARRIMGGGREEGEGSLGARYLEWRRQLAEGDAQALLMAGRLFRREDAHSSSANNNLN